MKNTLFCLMMLLTVLSMAQTPNAFKYQAVLRDVDGKIINNEQVVLAMSILSGSENGGEVYKEEHNVQTNSAGIIALNIGMGNVIFGDFENINWGSNFFFIKIELSQNNAGLVSMGTAPLLSVPYALHAKTVENKNDADADPTNELQTISIDGNVITLSGGGTIELPATSSFSGSYNDLTDIPENIDTDATDDFSGSYTDLINKPTLSGDATGELNNVTVQKIQGQNFSAGNPTTGQVLKWNGSAWSPGSDATVGGSGTDGVVESVSVISNGSKKTITLGMSASSPSTTLNAEFTDEVNDADADPTNELQTISIDGNTITLSDGGNVELPATSSFSGSYNDLTDIPENIDTDATDDFSGSYTDLINKPTLSGDATGELNNVTVQKIQGQNFSAGNPTTGQVLKWNGAAWAPGSDAVSGGASADGVVESMSVTTQDNVKTITLGLSSTAPTSNLNANFTDEVNDADADPVNEIQDLQLTEDKLTITRNNSATPIDLSIYKDDTQLTAAEVESMVAAAGYQLISADADTDPTNEIQTLSILGDTIALTKGGKVALPNRGWGGLSDEALFAVVNTLGDTVFAVYEGGVRVYVDESNTKARRGGFAVASTRPGKLGEKQEILTVTSDSVRIYLDESSTKARRGGFAVASTRPGKVGISQEILRVTNDSVRIYLDESTSKARRGGFAVASTRPGKQGNYENVMTVSSDSTRIYVGDANAGFGVENTSSGNNERLMRLVEENYFIGHQSGSNNNSGMYNTFFGYQSGFKHQTGNNNIYMGYQSAFNDVSGQNNIIIGHKAGFNNLSGSQNLFIGDSTGYNNTEGNGHVFLGYNAGLSNTIGYENTFVGYKSGQANTEGHSNAFFGTLSGIHNTTGFANVFIGPYAGYFNTTGRENVFIGLHCGQNNTSGYYNTFVGKTSGAYNTTGNVNTFLGFDAGLNNTIGEGNTFLGASTGNFNSTGNNNTYIGNGAGAHPGGSQPTTGSDNVFIGALAGYEATGSNNVFIGKNTGRSSTASNSLFIDNSETNTPLIYGNFTDGFERVEINGNFVVKKDFWVEGHAGGATTWNEPSDLRLKKNITTIPNALNRVKQLRGVNYEWKDTLHPESGRIKMGFVAQEAIEIIPEAVLKNDEFYSMQYAPITAILVEAIKEQQQIIEKQQSENQELKDKYTELEKRLRIIESKLK